MKTTQRSLTFFKVFDLAFFAPGTILAATCFWLWRQHLQALSSELATSAGILGVVGGIGAIYSAGLATHSFTWIFVGLMPKKRPEEVEEMSADGWPPLALLFEDDVRDDLILYFWYLRATCWNLACAILISVVLVLIVKGLQAVALQVAAAGSLFSALLLLQGRGYNRLLERSLKGRVDKRVIELVLRTEATETDVEHDDQTGG